MEKLTPVEQLLALRKSIDNFDQAIIHVLAERFRITNQIGQLKAEYNIPPSDPKRESEQTAQLRALAQRAGLNPDFAEKLLKFIIAEVVKHHKEIRH